jgi:mRNA interferase RelE/StbE
VKYRVHISSPAARAFNKLPEQVRRDMYADITALVEDPFPPNSKRLAGDLKGLRSLRTGDYRTAYVVDERERIVYVRGVGHRERFYDVLTRLGDEPGGPGD